MKITLRLVTLSLQGRLKVKISHSEDTTLAILWGCLYLLAYYL